jgi:hypothetical protein
VVTDGTDPLTVFRTFMTSGGYDDILVNNNETYANGTSVIGVMDASVKSNAQSSDVDTISTVDSSTELSARTALYQQVFTEGISTLTRLQDSFNISGEAKGSNIRQLQLDHVSLVNFGPYGGEKVSYPLSKRGLVLITAESTDGTGADSNGAGKVQYSSVWKGVQVILYYDIFIPHYSSCILYVLYFLLVSNFSVHL